MWASSAALAATPEDRRELETAGPFGQDGAAHRVASTDCPWRGRGQIEQCVSEGTHDIPPDGVGLAAALCDGGVKALYDDRPRGRSFSPLTRAKEAEIIAATQTAPVQATQWSCRSMAELHGISKASVQRIWHANGLKPHLVKTLKLSNDPKFISKLEDVVGSLYEPTGERVGILY